MDNPKAQLSTNKLGKCVIASEDIKQGEIIADFDGEVFTAEKCADLPKDIADHAIQFREHKWRRSKGIAELLNHSCDPNCGIKGLFTVVAMRDIKKGEELTWDYDMSEDADWRMDCLCGTQNCRKIVGSFRLSSAKIKDRYRGYISDWLVKEHNLNSP